MALATFSVRMDEALKKDFDELCNEFGMTASTAINVFARAVVKTRKIPFEIASSAEDDAKQKGRLAFMELREEAQKYGLQGMTLEQINEVIQKNKDN